MPNIHVRLSIACTIGLLLVLSLVPVASAEGPSQEEFPQVGLLAAVGNLPPNSISIPLPAGLAPGKLPPITGKLNRGGDNKWHYTVTNNFERPVYLSATLRQYSAELNKIATSAVSFRLKPNQSSEGQLPIHPNAAGCAVVMEKWKFLGKE